MKRKMTSKRALQKLSYVPIFEDDDRNMITDIDCCCVYIGDLCEVYEREVNIIKKDLEILEIIKKHKLLNYVLKNEKCANMYHLSKEEIDLLRELEK